MLIGGTATEQVLTYVMDTYKGEKGRQLEVYTVYLVRFEVLHHSVTLCNSMFSS